MSAMTRMRLFGSRSAIVQHLLRPAFGPRPVGRPGRDPHADPTQVLDQAKAQHDRNGPQFAECQRRDRLVGSDKPGHAFRVDTAVAVRDRLERQVVDARQARGGPFRETRQFSAEALRQVPLGGPDLLVDQVTVVEQPLRGRDDAPAGGDRCGELAVYFGQHRLVGRETRQQAIARVFNTKPMRDREMPTVLFHLLGAEELRAQRRFDLRVTGNPAGATGACARTAPPVRETADA